MLPVRLSSRAPSTSRCIGYQRHGRKLVQQLEIALWCKRQQTCTIYSDQKKLAQKLVDAIAQSKTKPWSRVLYGLGIRHVGSVNAQLLTQRFPRGTPS